MKKIYFALIFFLVAAFPIPGLCQNTPRKPIKTIIIDPGHGGLDPGALGLTESEANTALAVSLKLGDTIAKAFPDIKIVYTRTTDILPGNKTSIEEGLRYRADLANASGGDLFIAIHCNSAGKRPGGWYERRVVGKTAKYKIVKKGKKKIRQTYYEYQYENVWVENKAKGTETYLWAVGKNDAKISSVSKNNDYSGEIDSTSNLTLPITNPLIFTSFDFERFPSSVKTAYIFLLCLNRSFPPRKLKPRIRMVRDEIVIMPTFVSLLIFIRLLLLRLRTASEHQIN